MTSQPGSQTIAIQVLINISRSKSNQTMIFGELMYNMRNIFLEISYTKCAGETIPSPFSKKSNLISRSFALSFMQFVFIVCQVEDYRNILKLSCRPLAFISYSFFKKQKEIWN